MIHPSQTPGAETRACLVIDDPLLKPRYGFLDYEVLLEEMKEHGFFTEIAFIPWNYRRSHPSVVKLFADNPGYFGLCLHGCDHTWREYAGKDYNRLRALTAKAFWRMDEHERLTSLPYDPVMVFPQGQFSSVAMQTLCESRCRAAFNSTIVATDTNAPPSDQWKLPATTFYHGFPLFLRRYVEDRDGILDDFISGRPLIIREHHGLFREGYRRITDAVDWINSLGSISWGSLGSIVDHYCNGGCPRLPHYNSEGANTSCRIGVAFRRFACEFRDNWVERSILLTRLYALLRGTASNGAFPRYPSNEDTACSSDDSGGQS